jgi:hypothetical protein
MEIAASRQLIFMDKSLPEISPGLQLAQIAIARIVFFDTTKELGVMTENGNNGWR